MGIPTRYLGGPTREESEEEQRAWENGPRTWHRIAGLNQLAANVRQWPCETAADVEQLFHYVERMATDCGWPEGSPEVAARQQEARTWIRDRVLGKVANRDLEPYKLATLAQAVLRHTTKDRS